MCRLVRDLSRTFRVLIVDYILFSCTCGEHLIPSRGFLCGALRRRRRAEVGGGEHAGVARETSEPREMQEAGARSRPRGVVPVQEEQDVHRLRLRRGRALGGKF